MLPSFPGCVGPWSPPPAPLCTPEAPSAKSRLMCATAPAQRSPPSFLGLAGPCWPAPTRDPAGLVSAGHLRPLYPTWLLSVGERAVPPSAAFPHELQGCCSLQCSRAYCRWAGLQAWEEAPPGPIRPSNPSWQQCKHGKDARVPLANSSFPFWNEGDPGDPRVRVVVPHTVPSHGF